MYFAPIARHCMRCPAGEDAIYSYIVTIALAVVFALALVLVVVHRLVSAWKRVMGKSRSDASGIVRVFFNWIQMVSMLQSIKLQPPEEVTNAMETAEVVNVSVEWFPIQCTLRLTFFNRVGVYMAMPIVAIAIPLIYVYVMSKCTPLLRKETARKRAAERKGKKFKGCRKCFFAIIDVLSGESVTEKASAARARMHTRGGNPNAVETLQLEIDVLLDELTSAEVELTEYRRGEAAARPADDAAVADTAAAAETGRAAEARLGDSEAVSIDDAAAATKTSTPAAEDENEEEEEEDSAGVGAVAGPSPTPRSAIDGASPPFEDADADGGAGVAGRGAPPLVADDDQLPLEGDAAEGGADDGCAVLLSPLPLLAASSGESADGRGSEEGGSREEPAAFAGHAFFRVVSAIPISLRATPSRAAPKLPWIVRESDVVRTERIDRLPDNSGCFVHLSGSWGEGWVCDSLADGTVLLVEIDPGEMAEPAAAVVERHYRDELRHCFVTICAMTPGASPTDSDCIARESIEYVLPAKMNSAKQDVFFANYDADGDGSIDFVEFVAMYPALRRVSLFYVPFQFVRILLIIRLAPPHIFVFKIPAQDVALREGVGGVPAPRRERRRDFREG